MRFLEPLSNITTQDLLKMMVGRSVLWYGAGFFTAMLLSRSINSKSNIGYLGFIGLILLLAMLVAESIYMRKRIIPELQRRCENSV